MGAYTCEFGVVHKTCRCPTPHTIKCDKVDEHSPKVKKCRRLRKKLIGKRERHVAHTYYVSAGSKTEFSHNVPAANCKVYRCPGRD